MTKQLPETTDPGEEVDGEPIESAHVREARLVSEMTEAEMLDELTLIARQHKNLAAKISAIKVLRSMQSGKPPSEGFAALDELAERRERQTG